MNRQCSTAVIFACSLMLVQSVSAEVASLPPPECVKPVKDIILSRDPVWIGYSMTNREFAMDKAALASLHGLKDVLAKSGKKLFLLFTPYPAIFTPEVVAERNAVNVSDLKSRYRSATAALTAESFDTIDILQAYEPYLASFPYQRKFDHHWTSEGAAMVAAEVARRLLDSVAVPSPQEVAKSIATWDWKPTLYSAPYIKSIIADGCNSDDYKLTDKDFQFPAASSTGDAGDSLFGDQKAGIAVLGTSMSNASNGAFPRALEYFSGKPVINYAVNGGGATTSIYRSLPNVMADDGIDTVLWEMNWPQPDEIFGASSFAQGLISGACNPADPIFRHFELSGNYDEWIIIPNFIGILNKFSVSGDSRAQLTFELSELDVGSNATKQYNGRTRVLGATDENNKKLSWTYKVPSIAGQDGRPNQMAGLRIKLSSFLDYKPSGPVSISVDGCYKIGQ